MGRKSDDKKSFQLYNDYIQHFSLMSDEDAGKLIKAIFSYVNDQPFEELEGLPMMAFSFIRSQLQRDKDRYDARCEVNRMNGMRGGRPRKTEQAEQLREEPKKPNGSDDNQTVLKLEQPQEPTAPDVEEKPPKKEKEGYSTEFETFWKIYPRKTGKGEAYKKYKARLNDGWSPAELQEAAENYRKKCEAERTEEKYIKHAKTFLSESTPFEDFLNRRDAQDMNTNTDDDGANPFR